MTRPWYEKPMRIAALQCNYEEGDTVAVVDKWVESGFNVEQLFHPMAECYTAVFDAERHADVLTRYLARARERDLRIILYQNVHIISPSQNGRRDAWAMRGREGEFYQLYGTYYGCCVNSTWRDDFLGVLDTLQAYDIDGLFLDGPTMQGGCYCPVCCDRYRDAYGGELKEAEDPSEFFVNSRAAFVRDVYNRFKSLKPEALCYWNLSVMSPSASYVSLRDELPCNDIVGTEGGFMFYGPAPRAYLWHPTVAAKALEAVAPDKGRVIFMAADQKPWSWYPHTPVETQLCIASSVANGANVWYGLHGATPLLETRGGQAATDLMRLLARHEDCYDATRSAARTAVFYSYATEKSYRTTVGESDLYGAGTDKPVFRGNMSEALHGFCDLLGRSGIAYDLVTDFELAPERLAPYDCLLLPTCACLSDATCALLREFVERGGSLVAAFDSSLYDDSGAPRGDFALADVFGVSFGGETTRYANFNYLSACGSHELLAGIDVPRLPAPEHGLVVKPAASAEVLARFHAPQSGRYTDPTPQTDPAIVQHSFGAGRCVYLAGTFGETANVQAHPEYRKLLANAVRLLSAPAAALEGGLGNIEFVVRSQPGRLIAHLVNYAGVPPRPFERVAPQSGLAIRVRAAQENVSARALVADRPCLCERDGTDLLVRVPDLDTYEVVVIE